MQRSQLTALAVAVVIAVVLGFGGATLASRLTSDGVAAPPVASTVTLHPAAAAPPAHAPSTPAPSTPAPSTPAVAAPQQEEKQVAAPQVIATPESTVEVPQVDHRQVAEEFVAGFGRAHQDGDVEYLLSTLNPQVNETFGAAQCGDYVAATIGSIRNMAVLMVAEPTEYQLPGTLGPVTFHDALPVYGEWEVVSTGEHQTFSFHLVPGEGGYTWLTTCGQPKGASV